VWSSIVATSIAAASPIFICTTFDPAAWVSFLAEKAPMIVHYAQLQSRKANARKAASLWPLALIEQISVGPEPDEPKHCSRRFGINQQQVGPEMAVPIPRPIPSQGMVAVPRWQRVVVD
jgi:hypothetical protein